MCNEAMDREKILRKVIRLKRELALVEDALMDIDSASDLYKVCANAGMSFETTERLRVAGADRGLKINYE